MRKIQFIEIIKEGPLRGSHIKKIHQREEKDVKYLPNVLIGMNEFSQGSLDTGERQCTVVPIHFIEAVPVV